MSDEVRQPAGETTVTTALVRKALPYYIGTTEEYKARGEEADPEAVASELKTTWDADISPDEVRGAMLSKKATPES